MANDIRSIMCQLPNWPLLVAEISVVGDEIQLADLVKTGAFAEATPVFRPVRTEPECGSIAAQKLVLRSRRARCQWNFPVAPCANAFVASAAERGFRLSRNEEHKPGCT